MNYKAFAISAQGESHIRRGKECQDASFSVCNDDVSIIVVCDGHGGDDYVRSAFGSVFACETAVENIRFFLENADKEKLKNNTDTVLANLEASIISGWNERLSEHYAANPFTDDELALLSDRALNRYLNQNRIESAYGTTLLAAAVTKDFWFAIQIGDGKCVAADADGNFEQPVPWDDKCFLNTTTSMCDSEAIINFRHYYSEKLPAAVFLCSDGIDDSFSGDEKLNGFYKTVLQSFSTSDIDDAVSELREYLPRLSAKGSGDDVSVAVLFDMDGIAGISGNNNGSVTK